MLLLVDILELLLPTEGGVFLPVALLALVNIVPGPGEGGIAILSTSARSAFERRGDLDFERECPSMIASCASAYLAAASWRSVSFVDTMKSS